MGFIKKIKSTKKSGGEYNKALDLYRKLRQYPVKSSNYRNELLRIISLCQKAIENNDRNGDAHVLLSNTYFLMHIDLFSETTISLPLKLAASVIQQWNDEPMRQYPWTKNTGNGRKIYDMVSNALILNDSKLKYRIEQEMRQLKLQLFDEALTIKTLGELTEDRV